MKKKILNEFNSSSGILACRGFTFEEFPEAFDLCPITDRANSSGRGITFPFYGRIAIDSFTC